MSLGAANPNGPYDPQPQPTGPAPGPAQPTLPEIPGNTEPVGIPATDPDRAPSPGETPPGPPQTPPMPSDPQPRA